MIINYSVTTLKLIKEVWSYESVKCLANEPSTVWLHNAENKQKKERKNNKQCLYVLICFVELAAVGQSASQLTRELGNKHTKLSVYKHGMLKKLRNRVLVGFLKLLKQSMALFQLTSWASCFVVVVWKE